MDTNYEINTGVSNCPAGADAQVNENKATPSSTHYRRQKRDSGYSTDVSPSSASGNTRHFSFDFDAVDLNNEFHGMDLSNDVFSDDDNEISDDFDEADREVENWFSDSEEMKEDFVTSDPASVKFSRPAAPVPMSIEDLNANNRTASGRFENEMTVLKTYRNSQCQEAFFRPIGHSQWPSTLHTQRRNTDDLLNVSRPRFQPYAVCRGCSIRQTPEQTESTHQSTYAPLPDIVPVSFDRSVPSTELPSVSRQFEEEVAQRLRRISDEFDFASETRTSSSSFTLGIGIMKVIDRVRMYLSPPTANSKGGTSKQ